jgi:hypothetical protein
LLVVGFFRSWWLKSRLYNSITTLTGTT